MQQQNHTKTKERRSGEDRRSKDRFAVDIDIEWEGLVGRRTGTISDISFGGCFVMCSGEVDDGETVKIFLPLADGMRVQFWGEVVNHIFEIGFGMRFIEVSEPQKEIILSIIASAKSSKK